MNVSKPRKVLAGAAVGIASLAAFAGLARGQEAPSTTVPSSGGPPAADSAPAPGQDPNHDGKNCPNMDGARDGTGGSRTRPGPAPGSQTPGGQASTVGFRGRGPAGDPTRPGSA